MPQTIHVDEDPETLSRTCAELFVTLAERRLAEADRFGVVLSGGTTPNRMYELLAAQPLRDKVDWARVHIFWSDERCVPPEDPRSNFGMARGALLSHIPIDESNIHRVRGELPAPAAAADYQADLERYFGGGECRFDLVLLGLGDDGHTASLFPGSTALLERRLWVVKAAPPSPGPDRVSLTFPALNVAACVMFMVSGSEKAEMVSRVLTDFSSPPLPAQLVAPRRGELRWMLDRQAAAKIDPRRGSQERGV